MDPLIKYPINSIKQYTLSLKKKSLLIDKPWTLIDEDGEIQKFIFKKDKGLILSKNGKVTEGSWDYFSEANSLLVDRGTDKLLLNEQFVDENVLLLKKDGTDLEYFALANENAIPDYNIPRYLNSVKCKKLNIAPFKLLNGLILQIYGGLYQYDLSNTVGNYVELLDSNYNPVDVKNGSFITDNKKITFYLNDGKLTKVTQNFLIKSNDDLTYEIAGGSIGISNLNKRITLNGLPIDDQRIVQNDNLVFYSHQSKISKVSFLGKYELSGDHKITVEHKKDIKFSKGDKIVFAEPINPLPNGKYRVKGTLWKNIKVIDSIIQ